MNKQQIESLQMQLYMQGYKGKDGKALSIDGQMGPNTAYAAQTMLRDKGYNLTVDGIWGTQTQNAYNNYSSKIYDSSVNKDKPSSGIQNYRPSSSTTAVNTQPKVNTGSSLISSSAATAQKKIYDSSVGKDWSGTVNQSYSSSPVQKKSYDSSVGKDWSGTVNQNYSSTKPQSSAKSGTSHAYESLVQNKWPIAASEPKHSMGSTSSQKQQRDVIGEMLVEGLNGLERMLAEQSKAEAKPQPYQSLVQGSWPTLGQQSGIGARSLPQGSGKQDYVSQRVEQGLAEILLKADPKAQQVFTGREAIAEEQQKLNLLGFYGRNGKPLREDGILDQDTLLAWNDKTYGGVMLGRNNSPMANAQREWGKGVARQVAFSRFNPDVYNLQKALNETPYFSKPEKKIKPDGILGKETLQAALVFLDKVKNKTGNKLLDSCNLAIKALQVFLENFDATYSLGVTASVSPSVFDFAGYAGLAADTKGNIGLQYSLGGGVTAGSPGAHIGVYQSISNASSIDKLLGSGYHVGGTVAAPVYGVPLFVGGDLDIIPDAQNNTNYYGGTVAGGLSTPGLEAHVEWGETFAVESMLFNLFDEWDKFYEKWRE